MPIKDKKDNWFTRATLRAAMADRPEVMQASGWTYDSNNNLYQGDPNEEGATRLRKSLTDIALSAGLDAMGAELAMPYVINGLGKVITKADDMAKFIRSRKIMRKLNKIADASDVDDILYHSPGPNDIHDLYYFTGDTDRVIQTKRAGRTGKIVYADRTNFKHTYPSIQEAEDALDEAISYSSQNLKNKTTADIVKQISEDSARLNSGDKVSLITDEALSKDSYPLMLKLFEKNMQNGTGTIRPIIDNGTYRYIRLNEYGHNPKSLRRINESLGQMRTLLADPNIPNRIGVGKYHQYVPAFEFEKFDLGGFLRKYDSKKILQALNKLNQKM